MTKRQVIRFTSGIIFLIVFFLNIYIDAFLLAFYKTEWWTLPTMVVSMGVFFGSGMGAYMSFWKTFDTELFGK